jgi:DNA-binding beta-propeller fold protein YncE
MKQIGQNRWRLPELTDVAWFPDGRIAAVANSGVVQVIGPEGEVEKAWQLERVSMCGTIAISPDGKTLAVGGKFPTPGVTFIDVASGERSLLTSGHQGDNSPELAFGRDGTRLLTGDDEGAARIFDVRTKKRLTQVLFRPLTITGVALSPDDKTAYVAPGLGLHIVDGCGSFTSRSTGGVSIT